MRSEVFVCLLLLAPSFLRRISLPFLTFLFVYLRAHAQVRIGRHFSPRSRLSAVQRSCRGMCAVSDFLTCAHVPTYARKAKRGAKWAATPRHRRPAPVGMRNSYLVSSLSPAPVRLASETKGPSEATEAPNLLTERPHVGQTKLTSALACTCPALAAAGGAH